MKKLFFFLFIILCINTKLKGQCLQLGINTVASNFATKCVGDNIIIELLTINSNPPSTIYVISLNTPSNIVDTIFSPVPAQYLLPITTPTCGLPNNSLLVFVQAIDLCWPSGQQYPTVAVGPIYVAEPPEASVTLPNTKCIGDAVTLNAINVGGNDPSPGINCSNTNWLNPVWTITPGVQGIDWNIVSGSLSQTNPAPQISFTTPGSYNVSFTGGNTCGQSSDSDSICIVPPPVASFALAADTICAGSQISVSNTSPNMLDCDLPNITWNVTFIPGSTPTGCLPSGGLITPIANTPSLYSATLGGVGRYEVKMTVTSPASPGSINCPPSIYRDTVIVVGVPEVILAPITGGSLCPDYTFTPTFQSNQACLNTILNYDFSFPGSNYPSFNNSTGALPLNITYSSTGNYTASVTATTSFLSGVCASSNSSVNFTITAALVPQLSSFPSVICSGQNATISVNGT